MVTTNFSWRQIKPWATNASSKKGNLCTIIVANAPTPGGCTLNLFRGSQFKSWQDKEIVGFLLIDKISEVSLLLEAAVPAPEGIG